MWSKLNGLGLDGGFWCTLCGTFGFYREILGLLNSSQLHVCFELLCCFRRTSMILLAVPIFLPRNKQVWAPRLPWGSQPLVWVHHFPRGVSRHLRRPSILLAAPGQCKVKHSTVVNHAWCCSDRFAKKFRFLVRWCWGKLDSKRSGITGKLTFVFDSDLWYCI
jgi:hypothetical protein